MSVSTVDLLWQGQTGSRTSDSKRQYTAVYKVVTDDESDGPSTVLNSSNLPALNSQYSFGNDSDSTTLLKSLVPSRVEGNRMHWHVQATWETPSDSKFDVDEQGRPTQDPTRWHDDIDISHTKYQRPVEKAFYVKGYNGSAHARLKGREHPIVNSAICTFDPPFERDDSRQHIRIGKWSKIFPDHLPGQYIDTINKAVWTINKPAYGYRQDFNAYTIKCNNISGAFQIVNNVSIWKVNFEFEFRREGWLESILDRGLSARAEHGDPDGFGGIIDAQQVKDGEPLVRRLTDKKGVPLTEPVLFDGNGKPLKPGLAPVYGEWAVYLERDFTPLKL